MRYLLSILILLCHLSPLYTKEPKVKVGIDCLMDDRFSPLLKGKRIGIITNQTGVSNQLESTIDILKRESKRKGFTIAALFSPEHGINGAAYAAQGVESSKDIDNIPIFSLYGKTHRPTNEMLKDITLLICDIQDIGTRSYTYISTLFYVIEEASKRKIPVVVLDRPNPINGLTVDGPMLDQQWRSLIGYINIPYCHGMTIGELALYFNGEYKIGCKLDIIPMEGWKRWMTFEDTGLRWIPTSPYIPEATTAFYYPTTGILGELQLVNTGIGYTMPFKIVGAPWIKGKQFADQLNKQQFPGVIFQPFAFSPMYGRYAKENCEGVLIMITDPLKFKPVSTQYLLIGILKSLYPEKFKAILPGLKKKKDTLCKLNGTEEAYRIIVEDKHITWKLCSIHSKERALFMETRKKYLISNYD